MALPQVVVVGAGFGGLCTAIQLRRRGIRNFVVLEQAGDAATARGDHLGAVLEYRRALEIARRETLESGDTLVVDQAMYATGRVPNVRNLGLREAGVEIRASGQVVVDEYSRTSVDNIFAVGDVRAGSVKRVAAAVGEGSVVVSQIFAALAPR